MARAHASLPEFENPPVSEVAIAIQFDPIDQWRGPHAGLYWGRISDAYPHTEVKPPMPRQVETFGDALPQAPTIRVEMADHDPMRSWFIADPPTRLIQVQRDHFAINWRKVLGNEIYPRYNDDMRPRFAREWKTFQGFITDNKLGKISVRQCELTYVNDIPRGDGWEELSDSFDLLSYICGKGSDGFLPTPETISATGAFRMPGERGRLHFAVQHVRRQIDMREVIQLRLTARGSPESSAETNILEWMDLGHEWVVRGFADLTSAKAHQLWGRLR